MRLEILQAKKSFPEKVMEFFGILVRMLMNKYIRLMSKKKKGGEDYE